MVNNSTNINKTKNYISAQIIEHKRDHNMCGWKSEHHSTVSETFTGKLS